MLSPTWTSNLPGECGWPGIPRTPFGLSIQGGHPQRELGTEPISPSPVKAPAEVDAAWIELTEAGYEGHLEPWDAFWGMRYAVVHDPDGRPVDLFALLPSE